MSAIDRTKLAREALPHVEVLYERMSDFVVDVEEQLNEHVGTVVRANDLLGTLDRALSSLYLVGAALQVMATEPIAEEFPAGNAAPEVLTVRQVFYLRDLHRKANNPYPARHCEATRTDGQRCRAWALWGQAVCHAHATPAERSAHREMKVAHNAFVDVAVYGGQL